MLSLGFLLKADADNAEAAIKKLESATGTATGAMQGNFESLTRSITSGLSGIIPVAGIAVGAITALGGAMFGLATKAAEVGARIYETSEITGISAPILSGLMAATMMTGESFDSLAFALGRAERNLGMALTTGGKAQAQIVALAGGAEHLKKTLAEPEGATKAVEGLLHNIFLLPDPTQRMMALFELLGRGAMQNMETLRMLAQNGFGPLIEKAKEFNRYFTDEEARQAKEYTVSMHVLEGQLTGLGIMLGRDLIPAFISLFGHTEAGILRLEAAGNVIVVLFDYIVSRSEALGRLIAAAWDVLNGHIGKAAGDLTKAWGDMEEGTRKGTNALSKMQDEWVKARTAADAFNKSIEDQMKGEEASAKMRAAAEAAFKSSMGEHEKGTKLTREETEAIERRIAALKASGGVEKEEIATLEHLLKLHKATTEEEKEEAKAVAEWWKPFQEFWKKMDEEQLHRREKLVEQHRKLIEEQAKAPAPEIAGPVLGPFGAPAMDEGALAIGKITGKFQQLADIIPRINIPTWAQSARDALKELDAENAKLVQQIKQLQEQLKIAPAGERAGLIGQITYLKEQMQSSHTVFQQAIADWHELSAAEIEQEGIVPVLIQQIAQLREAHAGGLPVAKAFWAAITGGAEASTKNLAMSVGQMGMELAGFKQSRRIMAIVEAAVNVAQGIHDLAQLPPHVPQAVLHFASAAEWGVVAALAGGGGAHTGPGAAGAGGGSPSSAGASEEGQTGPQGVLGGRGSGSASERQQVRQTIVNVYGGAIMDTGNLQDFATALNSGGQGGTIRLNTSGSSYSIPNPSY